MGRLRRSPGRSSRPRGGDQVRSPRAVPALGEHRKRIVDTPTSYPHIARANSPKKSVTPDYIVSLEDGKRFRSLKRHLKTSYGMTPDEYRAKWNLPSDYPKVAPNYSASRSALAKSLGLGRKLADKPKGRGRKKAA
ncbi:hypothetical protein G6N73_03530 [Mesorhizobium camelthorni]|uniref:Transcriptional regulator n=1 Tax=Allomesorhizobium camelthorni TaxID=475069 RepID=A0A6G4W7X4_9HYPH|nr:hypothetical protein [Mesorhizobium camelthorni]